VLRRRAFTRRCALIFTHAANALARYGHEIIQVEATDVATINVGRGELEQTTSDLDIEMTNIRKGAIADLKSLTGSPGK
jgi:hypothetical protein